MRVTPEPTKQENDTEYKTLAPTVLHFSMNEASTVSNSNLCHKPPERPQPNIEELKSTAFNAVGFVGTLMDRIRSEESDILKEIVIKLKELPAPS